MKFLCDQMLAGLGRWLRTAGYDTEIAEPGESDKAILDRAIAQKRILLTRDDHFNHMKAPAGTIVYLKSNSLEDCIRELGNKLNVDWLHDPLSRCLQCNTPFVKPDEGIIVVMAPPDVRSEEIWYCPKCQKVFWEGSHTDRMREQLHLFQKK